MENLENGHNQVKVRENKKNGEMGRENICLPLRIFFLYHNGKIQENLDDRGKSTGIFVCQRLTP